MLRSSKRHRFISSALVVILVIVLMSVTAKERERLTLFEGMVWDALRPMQQGVAKVRDSVHDVAHLFVRMGELRRENAHLFNELQRLQGLENALMETRRENNRFRHLLGFKERTGVEGIAAQVVARNPNNWFSTVTLNRGANHGVRRDMVVVTAQGLVGRVSEVAPQTAKVMLITDPESGVGGLIQRSRDTGVVLGQTGDRARVIMKLFSPESAPLVGDKVITSGLGMVFPKGLSIGEVVSVETGDYGLVSYVEIEPAVDLDRLEEVLIIAVNVDGADPGPWGSSSHTAGDAS